MAVVPLTTEVLEERLQDARRTYKLNVGYAGLSTLPAGFADMVKKWNPHIMELELSSNKLSELPEELSEFRYLRTLRLKYNQLRKLPHVITRLPQLMVLELSGNQISRIDDSIANLLWLKELDLSGNLLVELPAGICLLPKLENLQLENNRLEFLPDAIGDLPNLVKLDISTNNLRRLPESMGHFKKIQRIDAANNVMQKVPPSMGHLKTLKELNLRYNNLDERYKAKAEEGLSRFLAFLREEEERERLEEIERLKPIGTPVGSYLEYRCKAEVNAVVKADAGEIVIDNRCWIRTGHTLCQAGNMLFLFGGTLLKDGSTTADLFWMTTDRMEWHNQPTKGDRPCPRFNHCAVYDEDNNRLVIIGGRSGERKRLNDVYFLELDTWTWVRPNLEGTPPTPREQAVATFFGGKIAMFGGHAAGARTNDLFLLDLSSWQWSQPATSGSAPSPRQASAICVLGIHLFVHGGRNNFVLEDLFVLDLMTLNWGEVVMGGRVPPPRHSHLITIHNTFLYLFGGQDQLGAQSLGMYRLPLPDNISALAGSTLKLEWQEWESELPYNKCRTYTFWKHQLSIYQLGSTTLGRHNEEDAEKGLVYWDVFKSAKLELLKEKQLDEEALRPKNAKRVRVEHTSNIAAKLPRSFTAHTAKEEKMIAYVQDFQRTFEELYPYRRRLFLLPKNECGVPKFVCTTVRPSQLSYTELYDLDGSARFVSDFLGYEALESALHPPEHLPSPMNVLNWQAGDSFDLAVVLCSLLLGVGYDAYVVMGYAPLAVTTNDQSRTECPVIENERKALKQAAEQRTASKGGEAKKPKYVVKQQLKLESKLDQESKAGEDHDTEDDIAPTNGPSASWADALPGLPPPLESVHEQEDECAGKRVHAWVLVMAGKRDVPEHVFVEPSTGRQYSPRRCPYLGVEMLWNHRNFWVCMQMPEPHSDSRAVPGSLSFQLGDPNKWESVLEDWDHPVRPEDAQAEGSKPAAQTASGAKTPVAQASKKHSPSHTPGGGPGPKSLSRTATTRVGNAVDFNTGNKTPSSTEVAMPPRTADNLVEKLRREEEGEESETSTDMPPSWVLRLTIPRDMFDMRCPRGSKLAVYHRCTQEIFARFGECSRWDGMVGRLMLYEDDENTVLRESRELFSRRKDALRERRVYPQRDTNIEYFEPGASFGVHELLTIKGERRLIRFYHSARLDGMLTREEQIGKKLMEHYLARDDRLVYRSVTYVEEKNDELAEDEDDGEAPKQLRSRRKKDERMLQIHKMAEKFARNPTLDADADVAKRVFALTDSRISVTCHYAEGRVTHSTRSFTKDGRSHIVQVNPLAEKPKASVLLEEYQALLQAEKDCTQAIRDSEWEVKEILRMRTNQEQNIVLVTPYYDIVRIKAEESDEEEEEATEEAYDYLSPFLPPLVGTQTLGREQALEVREKCLRTLKDRLIERANIIQARLDEESAALAKRQANFQRDRDQITRDEEEEYERAVEESMFRIAILEKRLKRHEEQALQKYYELDRKLRSDPRLRALMQPAM